jgi:hypothetical protein
MPRRRERKTNWKPQDERRLRVRAVRRGQPDPKRLSRAFIALALARAEAEARAQADAEAEVTVRTEADDDGHDGKDAHGSA